MPIKHTQLLKRAKLLKGLPAAILSTLAVSAREKTYAAGQTIFQRGDRGADILIVVKGRVRLSVLNEDGREFSFAHAATGEEFGEIAALDGGTRSANAIALTETTLLHLPAAAIADALDKYPEIARSIIAFLCRRLRVVSDHLEDIALFPLDVRLARLLMHALGPARAEGWHKVPISVPQGELALLLGASRQSVNESFASFDAIGARRRTADGYELHIATLRQLAGLDAEQGE